MPAGIEDAGEAGTAARATAGAELYELNVRQCCCGGLNFGYFYDASPLIAYDGEAAPGYTMDGFTPSTVPGCRAPRVWLDDGRSLYDALGADYALVRRDPSIDVRPLEDAARRRGVPLRVLDLSPREAGTLYTPALLLCSHAGTNTWPGAATRPPPTRSR